MTMSQTSSEEKKDARMALTSASDEGASQFYVGKRFQVELLFDLDEFEESKLTSEYVQNLLERSIGAKGVIIKVKA